MNPNMNGISCNLSMRKYMLSRLTPLLISLFLFLALALSVFLGYHGHYFISAICTITAILSCIIFSRKDAYAFRFLYPGLITFLFFMVLPIIFTVYIGFTNLSTGHYLSQEQVKKALVEEKRLAPDSIIAGYRLYSVEKTGR